MNKRQFSESSRDLRIAEMLTLYKMMWGVFSWQSAAVGHTGIQVSSRMLTDWCYVVVYFSTVQTILSSNYFIKTIDDVKNASEYSNITISDLHVPAGVPFKLLGLRNANVTFDGTTTFGYQEWVGHMMVITGENVTIAGAPNHIIYCGGERWWDGLGGNGGKMKPKFMELRLNHSKVVDLNIKNTPMHAISINLSHNLRITNILVNNWDGDVQGGHNTDGFNVYESSDVTIENCIVTNQDDCIAVKSGKDLHFTGNFCSGGHGLSIGSVGGRNISNVVDRVHAFNNTIVDSKNGVRVKTVRNATGRVNDVTFENIKLSNISKFGISVFGNYDLKQGGAKGEPTGGVPISNLTLKNIHGDVMAGGTNIWVYVSNASSWDWTDIRVTGGRKPVHCEGFPSELSPLC